MSTMHDGLRYTLRGSAAIEKRMAAMMSRVAGSIAKHFRPHEYRSVVLLGGYGRGEGGVIRDMTGEHLHNNIDLLLITATWGRKSGLKKRLDAVLAPIAANEKIGIDTGVIGEMELRHAPPHVIWFDVRWGHRTILGDAAIVPSLRPLAAKDIAIDDVHALLVNRASLLVINDAIFERGEPAPHHARYVVKHLMKAIIGHGDALLFTHGRYHAGYLEKQRRMRDIAALTPGLAELYDAAAEFRFSPDYERYARENLRDFTQRTRDTLAAAHLAFERLRSDRRDCTFANHIERVLENKPSSTTFAARMKRMANANASGLLRQTILHRKEAHGHCPRAVLAAVLPTVLYGSNTDQARLTQSLLRASDCSPQALRHAYLRYWAEHGDPNFRHTAEQLGIHLE